MAHSDASRSAVDLDPSDLVSRDMSTIPSGLYIIFSLPKSGAQAFASALDAGFVPQPYGKHVVWKREVPNGLHVEMPLTRTEVAQFEHGWIHTHAPCTFAT